MVQQFDRLWHKYLDDNKIGDRKICPICNYSGLFEIEDSKNERNICPKCQSTPRTRLYYMYLLKHDMLTRAINIVGVSPDKAIRSKLLDSREFVNYTVIGISDLEKIPFEDNSVDFVMANYIIDRIENKDVALKEISRVLKTTGIAMLSVFFRKSSDLSRLMHYTEEQYLSLLDENGYDATILSSDAVCGGKLESIVCGIGVNDKIVIAGKKND